MKARRNATQCLVGLQSRREHSQKELRTKLHQRGYEAADIEKAMAFAAKHDLQSDTKYAQSQARTLGMRKGNRSVSARLAAAGVDKDVAQAVMSDLDAEAPRALHTLRRFDGLERTPQLRQRAWRFLAARGFSGASIALAWRQYESPSEES